LEKVLASRSVSITELERSPSPVLAQAGSEAVAVLNQGDWTFFVPKIGWTLTDRPWARRFCPIKKV
jgi:hypothetical protein